MSRLSRRVSRVLSLRRGPEVMPVRDLILMDEINEDNVVAVLKKRFTDDEIYVSVVLS
jgi:myosin heavy subunit